MYSLTNNPHIVIRPADKGGAIVVMNTTQYMDEANRQLSVPEHYELTPFDPVWSIKREVDTMVTEAGENGIINTTTKEFITRDYPRTPILHLLTKIHKSLIDPPGPPIMSGIGSILEPLSKLVDRYLQPLYVKSQHA